MKKVILVLCFLFSTIHILYAGHSKGGHISWECQGNGQYVFYLSSLIDCDGIGWGFTNHVIYVDGLPSPGFSNITVNLDTARMNASNQGVIEPYCSNSSLRYRCNSNDPGTLQQIFFKSAPVTINGNPPAGGWTFYWEIPCCRPNNNFTTNLNTSSVGNNRQLIKSVMYSKGVVGSASGCFDSSPRIYSHPDAIYCRTKNNRVSLQTYDSDGDSLVYEWGNPVNGPFLNQVNLGYKSGFSFTNPLPDASFDSRNTGANLNQSSGYIDFTSYSGQGLERFLMINKVSSYRDGVKMAEVDLNYQISVIDCHDTLPSGLTNNEPFFNIPLAQNNAGVFLDTVVAGSVSSFPIYFFDNDVVPGGNGLQAIYMEPSGIAFSNDFTDSTDCKFAFDSCATLSNPFLNADANALNGYAVSASTGNTSNFRWKTSCSSLGQGNAPKTYYFYFKYRDDFCPVPASNNKTVAITVMPSAACGLLTSNNKEAAKQASIQLFPNPSKGNFTLSNLDRKKEYLIQIRSLSGQLIESYQSNQEERLNLEIDGSSGIYFIEVRQASSQAIFLKVVKQ